MAAMTRAERRTTFRRRALMGGTLRFVTRNGVLSCLVRNISVTGAKLDVAGGHWLPESFELDIPHRDLRVDARVVWRDNQRMGIEFIRRNGETFRSVQSEERVRVLEEERARLARRVRQLSEEM